MFLKVFAVLQIAFYCITCVTSQNWVIDDYGCRTPDGGVGNCILAKNCKVVVDFLTSASKPISSNATKKLREYICGYRRNQVKVCCSTRPISLMADFEMPGELKMAESVLKHRNLNLLPADCGYIGIPNKISNGKNAGLGNFPWMALLTYETKTDFKFKCGGTIINEKYILTAAHCITGLKEPVIRVRVGEYDISTDVDCEEQDDGSMRCIKEPVQDLEIEKIIPHPNFTKDFDNPEGFNDIGLLRVAKMRMTETVVPICLPIGEAAATKLDNVIITGWGFVKKQYKIPTNILQKVSLPVISRAKCQKAYRSIYVSEKQMCANGKEQDTCSGDSGGPLQNAKYFNEEIRMVQYGIISFGDATCGSGAFPGLYTKVDSYLKWILDNMEP